jgi:hypothetical protein
VVFHTDQGGEYTGGLFAAACQGAGVTQWMGRTGSAPDNATAESFDSTVESELLRESSSAPASRPAEPWRPGATGTTRSAVTPSTAHAVPIDYERVHAHGAQPEAAARPAGPGMRRAASGPPPASEVAPRSLRDRLRPAPDPAASAAPRQADSTDRPRPAPAGTRRPRRDHEGSTKPLFAVSTVPGDCRVTPASRCRVWRCTAEAGEPDSRGRRQRPTSTARRYSLPGRPDPRSRGSSLTPPPCQKARRTEPTCRRHHLPPGPTRPAQPRLGSKAPRLAAPTSCSSARRGSTRPTLICARR